MSPDLLTITKELRDEVMALRAELAELREHSPSGRAGTNDGRRRSDEALELPEFATHATAEQLAARWQVSEKYVEARADLLGATPISDAPNSKLRFRLATADAYMAARERKRPSRRSGRGRKAAEQKPARAARTPAGAERLRFAV